MANPSYAEPWPLVHLSRYRARRLLAAYEGELAATPPRWDGKRWQVRIGNGGRRCASDWWE
jgi:hypothetical protein